MKEFLDALSKFSPAQMLASLAILTPFVAAIWVALKWAFDTRLKNLETALADFRADFERRLARELAKTTDVHEDELKQVRAELEAARAGAEALESRIAQLTGELDNRDRARANELASAEQALLALLEEFGSFNELPPKYLSYLCENPGLIPKISFSEVQLENLRKRAKEGVDSAKDVYEDFVLNRAFENVFSRPKP